MFVKDYIFVFINTFMLNTPFVVHYFLKNTARLLFEGTVMTLEKEKFYLKNFTFLKMLTLLLNFEWGIKKGA